MPLATGVHFPPGVMDGILVTAASGLRTRMESLDLLGNNLANAATGGYKGDRELYTLYMRGGSDPALPTIEGQWTDFSQGTLETTGNPLDMALQGQGFFAVNGPSGVLYTRNGGFQLSSAGVLQTSDGYTVRLAGQQESPRFDRSIPIEAAGDGTLRQGSRVLGKLEVVGFEDQRLLSKFGKNYFQAQGDAAKPASAEVLAGKLESSNVSSAESAVRIISVLRQSEMLQKAIALASGMGQRVVNEVAQVGQ
jgi:flagellar basal body rod protein FlgG